MLCNSAALRVLPDLSHLLKAAACMFRKTVVPVGTKLKSFFNHDISAGVSLSIYFPLPR